MKFLVYICILSSLWLVSCNPAIPEDIALAMNDLPDDLDYNIHVKPILSDKCFACHGPDKAKQKAGLRIDLAEYAYASMPESPDKVAIDPGDLGDSEIFHRIISADPDYVMPTPDSHLNLTTHEKAVLIKWIKDGAEYKPHWAFVKPEKAKLPSVENEEWVKNPIDNFILAKLEEKKLQPSPQADKETLLRRVTFDITGLPPTLSQIDNFLKDKSDNAFEKVVDRLLATPQYGERMSADWLDIARFADSHGYTVDRLRDMSPYRDWVIKSFNENRPYDKFIHWQLAGDLMKGPDGGKPTKEMLIATAFNRNHQQNLEGGIIEDEFKTEYVVDRTNTFGDAFMGLSVGCAKCHDHKYDPFSQKNYYELFSFFNNIDEAGQISWDESMPAPVLQLPTDEQERIIAFLESKTKKQEGIVDLEKQKGNKDFEAWVQKESYTKLQNEEIPKAGLQSKFSFNNKSLKDEINPKNVSYTTLQGNVKEKEVFIASPNGFGIKLDGDAWLDCGTAGVFRRSEPFSVGLKVKIPSEMKEGVIFHKSLAERLYNFKGYHLYLKNGKLELNMAHVYPSNAITKLSKNDIPRDKWVQLTMTYDGSSQAKGMKLYLDGKEVPMEIVMDQLNKDILLKEKNQPGLQIGGWWRGLGFKNGEVDDILVYNRALTEFEINIIGGKSKWKTIAAKKPAALNSSEKGILKEYYFSAIHQPTLEAKDLLKDYRTALADSVETVQELMVFQESKKPKQAYILERGIYDNFGEKVFPNTPEAIFPFPEEYAKNRLGLAKWLTHKDNPLTARVAANRYWQLIFGRGLSKTSEDFGNQGEMPSHPKLLDWLAVNFQESNWDVKALIKLMVMSNTYQQDSRASKELKAKDSENIFLARGPSARLTAEMMRDNALASSGLMNSEIGGKSIKPYQPEGLWRINGAKYEQDTGDVIYKRSLYVVVKRSVPNPTLGTFDASSRSFCTVRRQKTNTPLQALVTLNDPTFVEAAKVLGEEMSRVNSAEKAISTTYKKLAGKNPSKSEVALLLKMQQNELNKFRQSPAKAKGWLDVGQYKVDKTLDQNLVAANTVVASTIMNSDAVLMKR
ncbi:Planctomycete cytochrome C [Spirosomataceae bacterium TFI 002]|nr:Planctomycete cytochrome C [Spirosomataceae bacterium TFI 002]